MRRLYSCALTSSCMGVGGGGAGACFLRLRKDMSGRGLFLPDGAAILPAHLLWARHDPFGSRGPRQLAGLLLEVGHPPALAVDDLGGRPGNERLVGKQGAKPFQIRLDLADPRVMTLIQPVINSNVDAEPGSPEGSRRDEGRAVAI